MRENTESQSMMGGVRLQEILLLCLRKWWVIVLCFVLAAAIAFGYTKVFVTPMYTSSISIYINNSRSEQISDYISGADLSASTKLVDGYRNIVTSNRVLEAVADELDHDYTAGGLAGYIYTGKVGETQIFRVYVTHSVPAEAARIANTIAKVFPAKGAEIIEGSSARIIDYAKVPTSPVSPSYTKNTFFGGVVGAILAVALLIIQYLRDSRIKDEEELLALFDLPVLGRVPDLEQEGIASTYQYAKKPATKEGAS